MNTKKQLSPPYPILVVDDNRANLKLIDKQLHKAGLDNLILCNDSREVAGLLQKNSFDIALIDLKMPYISGEELLTTIRKKYPDLPVIIVTATDDVQTAVQCMKIGAFDYVVKPFDIDLLLATITRALKYRKLDRENRELKLKTPRLKNRDAFKGIVTQSKKMHDIFITIESVAPSQWPVLITGETGVGKEKVSRVIHDLSHRKGPLVPVNVAGLDDNLFSDTLFGHVRGAFTGAERTKRGLIEQAAQGTIFLDEIGDLSPSSQVKLLRLIQEGEYYPLGENVARKIETRIIAATNKNLWELQRSGKFREDLHFRLRTHHIHIPPLRDRIEDIPLLVDFFLEQAATMQNKKKPSIPKELVPLLNAYPFPGNIREIQGMVFDAMIRLKSRFISLDIFRAHIEASEGSPKVTKGAESDIVTFHRKLPTLKQINYLLIMEALRRSENNQSQAATMLGITQQALSKRLKTLNEKPPHD